MTIDTASLTGSAAPQGVADPARTPKRLRAFLLALVGILCLQAAWALVVPPFRGLDEHDHAYKTAAVARGDWSPIHAPSPEGWGMYVEVPADLVAAARPVCEEFPYTTPDNCVGDPTAVSDVRRVASSAAHYNPAYYAIAGLVSLPFGGASSLYAMRATAALMCAVLMAVAAVALRSWSRSVWPATGFLLAMTPTLTYTTAMAAPNGLELAAALALWVALLGIARHPGKRPPTGLVALAGAASIPLAVVRGMGPLWLSLIVVTVALLVRWSALRRMIADRRVALVAAGAAIATLYAAWWTLASGSTEVTSRYHFDGSPWAVLPAQWVLWFFQSMGVFPARDELAPLALYVVGFAAWGVITLVGLRVSNARERLAMATVVVVSTAIASAVIVASYEVLGAAWQGRYSYPYTLGFLLLCGFAVDRSGRWSKARWPLLVAAGAGLTALLIGQLSVLADQRRTSSLADSDAWLQPHPAVIVALSVGGTLILVRALSGGRKQEPAGR